MACISTAKVVQCFLRALELEAEAIGPRRAVLLTGIPVSAQQMWDAVKARARGRVRFEPDPRVQEIMDAAPKATRSARAAKLGFPASSSIEEIVDDYQEDAALAHHG
jgi:nucleoside-diphosphate-sugar epimerase